MKKIDNIVMYKVIEDGKQVVKSCVFYDDGTYEEGNESFGIKAIKEVADERNIKTKEELKAIINKEVVYTMTEAEVKEKIKKLNAWIDEDDDDDELVVHDPEKKENVVILPTPISSNSKDSEETEDSEISTEEDVEEEIISEEEYNGESEYTEFNSEDEEVIEDEALEEKTERIVREHPIASIALVLGVAAGIVLLSGIALKKCSKDGVMTPSTTETITTVDNTDETTETEYEVTDPSTYIINNNDLYNDYTYAELLDVTTNDFQKKSMINASSAIVGFNDVFANNYTESGHDIKAALTFDEVVALQQAYNNYTTDEVRAYFNGYEVDAAYMSNAYKAASLQLIGAHIIEDSEHPVDMTVLIDSQEGRDFYNRYHAMYLAAKEATGEEQLRLVKEFYDEVRKDFPITEEVRTEGISHSEDHNSIKDYQLAVIPMIDAAERIFQNLEIDYTLGNDSEFLSNYDFMNSIGLCNHADDKFERLETITLTAYEDNENPLFVQYRSAIIAELIKSNDYVIDDAHRELSNLRRFQKIINGDELWKHKTTLGEEYNYTYEVASAVWYETEETSYEVTTIDEAPITEEGKKKVDEETAQENEDAKKKAEEEAASEAARQQEEADKDAKAIEDEIKEDEEQLEKDINDINKTIDENNKDTDTTNNTPVNENDYDNIDFDDEYTNENGDLDGSVQNITTDGTGANEVLPDPNVTGAEFDSKSANYSANYSYEDIDGVYVEYTGVEGAYVEYDIDYVAYDADGNPIVAEEEGYQYTR